MSQEPKSLSKEEENNLEETKERTEQDSAGAPGMMPGQRLEPTRYGDWEKGGRCIDF
jgi:hypothetical protein